jgi:hypothetical protein
LSIRVKIYLLYPLSPPGWFWRWNSGPSLLKFADGFGSDAELRLARKVARQVNPPEFTVA